MTELGVTHRIVVVVSKIVGRRFERQTEKRKGLLCEKTKIPEDVLECDRQMSFMIRNCHVEDRW